MKFLKFSVMRREINVMRSRIFEETRDAETMSNELSKQLDSARRIINDVVPYLNIFEYFRWFVGLGKNYRTLKNENEICL